MRWHLLLISSVFCFTQTSTTPAQSVYEKPSKALIDIVDAPTMPTVSIDPHNRWLLLMDVPGLPPLAELAQRELRIAGSRISPQTRGQSRTRYLSGMTLKPLQGGEPRRVTGLPTPTRIGNVNWSPDGMLVSFTCTREVGGELTRIEPWMLQVDSATAKRVADISLNLTAGTPPHWLPDSSGIIAALVPAVPGQEPMRKSLPDGPVIQESLGRTAPARTYQDLLKDADDKALFDYYFTSQLARIDMDGTVSRIGIPQIYWYTSPSPSGQYLLVQTIHRPYSYRVPATRFPRKVEVWDIAGRVVHGLANLPLQEEVPMAFGSVPTGPRGVTWRADREATLVWVEALDDGDARKEAEFRDRVFQLDAPFKTKPVVLASLSTRYAGVTWGNDQVALIAERWWKNRMTRTWHVAPGEPSKEPQLFVERSYQDRYSDPGRPETRVNSAGRSVLFLGQNDSLFLIGSGASAAGDRPFLDKRPIGSPAADRLFQSEAPFHERPIRLVDLDDDGEAYRLITIRESVDRPPNYFLRDLKTGNIEPLTDFQNPTPQLAGCSKEMIKYKRNDGVELSATLYLPPGYESSQGPLPLLMWAYPREFKSKSDAGQISGSPHDFDLINHWSPMIFLALGYAVLDGPTMPIIGEGDEEPNDTYVQQLVASAQAAADEVVRRGVTNPGMIAIGGHSYGAFMTANLLAHSDIFAAGIARSGAYNRTLTPFGFQAEERSLWEAPEIYFAMSPFMHAHKVNEPILLIHGQLDNNSGTFPMQSERFFAALKGNGATVRLCMLPYESHGYRSRESLLHMLWEQEQLLEKYVRKSNKP
jgi:dipeptidyl aminopeptidase/acylaminoacyl peptidase